MTDALTNELRRLVAQNFVDGFVAAIHESGRIRSSQFRALGEALSAGAVPEGLRARVHRDIGQAAQAATVRAYERRSPRRRLQPYRVGTDPRTTRYAGGALLRALRRDDFFRATPNGLSIINVAALNREARQWARLNYGAGSAAGSPPGVYVMELLNASIGLPPNPRPPFRLPPGFWIRNGERVPPGEPGTAQFFPRGLARGTGARGRPNVARMTRGIQATNFLDAGVREMARQVAPAYLTMYREFYNSQVGKAHFQRLGVRAPRPRSFRA